MPAITYTAHTVTIGETKSSHRHRDISHRFKKQHCFDPGTWPQVTVTAGGVCSGMWGSLGGGKKGLKIAPSPAHNTHYDVKGDPCDVRGEGN